MKKLLILSLAVAVSFQLSAQKLTFSSAWKIKKIGISVGKDLDMLPQIGDDYFLNAAKDLDRSKYDGLQLLSEDMTGAVCENPDIDIDLTLLPPGMKNVELNVSLLAMFNRVDGATFETIDPTTLDRRLVMFNSNSNELALESTIRKRWSTGFLNFYGGIGTNIGMTYSGQVNVHGENIRMDEQGNMLSFRNTDLLPDSEETVLFINSYGENYEMKNALHQRVFAHAGIGFLFFKRIEIGIEGKYGVGYRYFGGDSFTPSVLNSYGLVARYVLK